MTRLLPRVLTCLAFVLTSWNAAAVTITNGSFEFPGFTNATDSLPLDQFHEVILGWRARWSETNAIAEWVKAPTYAVDDGSYAVRLGNYAGLTTMINTIQGQKYHVSIRAAGGSAPGTLMADAAAGRVLAEIPAGSPFSTYEFDFMPDPGTPGDGDEIGILVLGGPITVDKITVTPPPIRLAIQVAQVQVCWNSESDKLYQVECRYDAGAWAALGSPVQGNGSNQCVWDTVADQPRKFYRVREAQ